MNRINRDVQRVNTYRPWKGWALMFLGVALLTLAMFLLGRLT